MRLLALGSRTRRRGVVLLLAAAGVAAAAAPAASALRPLRLGIYDQTAISGPQPEVVLDRMTSAGATLARINVSWSDVAPAQRPDGFNPSDPADPHYNWAGLDTFVRNAVSRGLDPVITTDYAPPWAEGTNAKERAHRFGNPGTYKPDPREYGAFAHALAARYSGHFPDPAGGGTLPRVRYFQAWNEPNYGQYLVVSQTARGAASARATAAEYVRLLNAFYAGVKSVDPSDVVISAGLGPFGNNGTATDVDPQLLLRDILCVTLRGRARTLVVDRHCHHRAHFDAWAHHPYTLAGTPTTKGVSPDAGAMGNVPQMVRTVNFAVRHRLVAPAGRKPFWVTEFGWFSNPPGIVSGGHQLGKPLPVHARYLSESEYRLWRAGAAVFIWYQLRDQNQAFEAVSNWPGGLYFAGKTPSEDRPKPALTAFRFPFYAQRSSHGRVLFWGFAHGAAGVVTIQRASGKTWRPVAALGTDARGMFYARRQVGRGTYRARAASGLTSYPFPVR